MSNTTPLNPALLGVGATAVDPATTPLTEADAITLSSRLEDLRRIWAARSKVFIAPPGEHSEVELSLLRKQWEAESQSLIREQIAIIAKLRRTSAGPAKKGGKRAKTAPLDLGALLTNIMKAQ